jgi:hypothetical protein
MKRVCFVVAAMVVGVLVLAGRGEAPRMVGPVVGRAMVRGMLDALTSRPDDRVKLKVLLDRRLLAGRRDVAVSEDLRHYAGAEGGKAEGPAQITLDGKPVGKPIPFQGFQGFLGSHVVSLAGAGDQAAVDGQALPLKGTSPDGWLLSPDGSRWVYVLAKGRECAIILDGAIYAQGDYDSMSSSEQFRMMAFSPDSRHFACSWSQGATGQPRRGSVRVDGKDVGDFCGARAPFFSPDSKHLAFFYETKHSNVGLSLHGIWLDGKTVAADGTPSAAGFDSKQRLVFMFMPGNGKGYDVHILGDKETVIPRSSVALSPDGSHIAWHAPHGGPGSDQLIVDGVAVGEKYIAIRGLSRGDQANPTMFGSDLWQTFAPTGSKAAYEAWNDVKPHWALLDGKVMGEALRFTSVFWSPDGQRCAFLGVVDDPNQPERLFLDDPNNPLKAGRWERVVFSQDAKHWAALAVEGLAEQRPTSREPRDPPVPDTQNPLARVRRPPSARAPQTPATCEVYWDGKTIGPFTEVGNGPILLNSEGKAVFIGCKSTGSCAIYVGDEPRQECVSADHLCLSPSGSHMAFTYQSKTNGKAECGVTLDNESFALPAVAAGVAFLDENTLRVYVVGLEGQYFLDIATRAGSE